jgi:hypothetical protein
MLETFIAGVRYSSKDPFWFLAVSLLQQLFHSSCCLYLLRLFIESFCHLSLPCVAFRNNRLIYGSFEIINKIIAYCLCFFCIVFSL